MFSVKNAFPPAPITTKENRIISSYPHIFQNQRTNYFNHDVIEDYGVAPLVNHPFHHGYSGNGWHEEQNKNRWCHPLGIYDVGRERSGRT